MVLPEIKGSIKWSRAINNEAFSDLPSSSEAARGNIQLVKQSCSLSNTQAHARDSPVTRSVLFSPERRPLSVRCSSSEYPFDEHATIKPSLRSTF